MKKSQFAEEQVAWALPPARRRDECGESDPQAGHFGTEDPLSSLIHSTIHPGPTGTDNSICISS